MKELNLLMIIAREKDHAAYKKYFSRHKLAAYATVPCHGTAQNKTLDLLGIGIQLRKNIPIFSPDLKLVKISGTNSRDKQFPNA